MVKNKKQNGKPKAKKAVRSRGKRVVAASGMGAYRALLLDPCNAPFAPPPGLGPGTGLFMRHRTYWQPSVASTVTGLTSVSVGISLQPHNGSYISKTATDPLGVSAWTRTKFITGTFIGSDSVQAYRAVAACLKWIPTGSVMNRAGVVHRGYAVDRVVAAGDTDPLASAAQIAPTTATNAGPEVHEVKWFPADPSDLDFRDSAIDYTDGTGNCVMVAVNIDATGNGSVATVNGFFEITVVYEWMPNVGKGMVSTITPPPRYSLADVLGSIENIGMAAVGVYSLLKGGPINALRSFSRTVNPRIGMIGTR
jgi:hypothetical protein